MTPGERWLATLWPLVRTRLPAAPARVVEVGCGPLGGFVPIRITSTLTSGGALVVVEWASDRTTKQAGYIAAEMNGSPQGTSGPATSAIGHNATDFIAGR